MTYRLAIVLAAERDLARLDPPGARRVRAELLSLAGERDPRRHVKRLKGARSPPFYATLVWDSLVILQILDDRLIIVAVEVGHRSSMYKDLWAGTDHALSTVTPVPVSRQGSRSTASIGRLAPSAIRRCSVS